LQQVFADGVGAAGGQGFVEGVGATGVAMAFDAHMAVRVGAQVVGVLREHADVGVGDGVGGYVEMQQAGIGHVGGRGRGTGTGHILVLGAGGRDGRLGVAGCRCGVGGGAGCGARIVGVGAAGLHGRGAAQGGIDGIQVEADRLGGRGGGLAGFRDGADAGDILTGLRIQEGVVFVVAVARGGEIDEAADFFGFGVQHTTGAKGQGEQGQ